MFGPDLDIVLTLSTADEAPAGFATTGDPIFNAMWTLLHAPCVAVPIGYGDLGLPLGIQLVGPCFRDARLLKIAAALAPILDSGAAVMC